MAFDESLQALFCGAGDRAAHVTFEGEAEVAFAAASPGQPPVAGVLRDVVLDVRPPWSAGQAAREADGARVLALLGVHAGAASHETGLPIEAVDPGSRAAAAGLQAGDVVTRADGVRVASPGDTLPAPGEREGIVCHLPRHGGDHGGDCPSPASRARRRTICASPSWWSSRRWPSWSSSRRSAPGGVEALLQGRGGAASVRPPKAPPRRRGGRPGASWGGAVQALAPSGPGHRDRRRSGAPRSSSSPSASEYLIAAKLDVAMLFVAAAAGLAAAALGGTRSAGVGAASARRCTSAGSTRRAAISPWRARSSSRARSGCKRWSGCRADGPGSGWPSRSPASLLACALVLAAARIDPRGADPEETLGRGLAAEPESAWARAVGRGHRVVVQGLACALFFGGWAIPGVAAARQEVRPWLEVAGALVFAVKVAALVVAVGWSRVVFPAPGLATVSRADGGSGRVPLALAARHRREHRVDGDRPGAVDVGPGEARALLVVVLLATAWARVRWLLFAAWRRRLQATAT